MDKPNGFAGNDGGDIEIAFGFRCRIVGDDTFHILQKFELAAHPAPGMIIDQAAPVKRRGPDIIA